MVSKQEYRIKGKNMKKKLWIGIAVVVGLALLGYYGTMEETYPEEQERLKTYLEKTHGLQIHNGYVYASARSTNGVEEGDLIGVFYDKRDPSFMIQMAIDQDDQSIKDSFR